MKTGTFRYSLEKYNGMKTRHICPNCGKRELVRYIDIETKQYIHDSVGRCNREIQCGYHLKPADFLKDNTFVRPEVGLTKPKPKPVSYIPEKTLIDSLNNDNNLARFLLKAIPDCKEALKKYRLGTSHKWPGSTVFWQIDQNGKIRTGKIILYDLETGRRVKNKIFWSHCQTNNFELKQCFFGEHLLNDKSKTVAIVESEKTAIIASALLPEFIWIATGGLQNLNAERCTVLKGRNVILFPDAMGYDTWKDKAKEALKNVKYNISKLLEDKATDEQKKDGWDIADFLLMTQQPATVSQTFEAIKKYSFAEHLNYHDDLEQSGYYSELLRVLDDRRIKHNLNFDE